MSHLICYKDIDIFNIARNATISLECKHCFIIVNVPTLGMGHMRLNLHLIDEKNKKRNKLQCYNVM